MPHRFRFAPPHLWPFLVLIACAPPEIADLPVSEAARDAPPPRLEETASFDAALARAEPDAERLDEAAIALAARARALRARGAELSAPVVDPTTGTRLDAARR